MAGARPRGRGLPCSERYAVPLEAGGNLPVDRGTDVVALDDAMTALARIDARKVRVVDLRDFAGLTVDETAAALDVSADTVMRDLKMAKVWLLRELRHGGVGNWQVH